MSNALTEAEQSNELATYSEGNLLLDVQAMEHMMKVATFMAAARQLPQHLKTPADCLAVVMQAAQWKMNPFAIASQTYSVNDQLAYGAQLVNAVVTNSGQVKGSFTYDWFGDWGKILGKTAKRTNQKTQKEYIAAAWNHEDEAGLGIEVSATLNGEDEPRKLRLLMAQVTIRNSPLWAEDPRQQIAYLAVKRWSRLYAPQSILGVYTVDELEPISPEKDVTPQGSHEPAKTEQTVIESLSDADFMANEPAWKAKWLRGAQRGLTLAAFSKWVLDQTGKTLTQQQSDHVMNVWNAELQPAKQTTTVEGQATAEVSAQHQDFLDGMAQQDGQQ